MKQCEYWMIHEDDQDGDDDDDNNSKTRNPCVQTSAPLHSSKPSHYRSQIMITTRVLSFFTLHVVPPLVLLQNWVTGVICA